MRPSFLAGLVGVIGLLAGCGSTATTAETSAPVTSESAAGAVASADSCPQGPPARAPLISGATGPDGVVGVVVNSTAAPIWVWNASNPDSKYRLERWLDPCQLAPGDRAAFASWKDATLYASVTRNNRVGTRIHLYDPAIGYPGAQVTGFKESTRTVTNCGTEPRDSDHTFSEGESRDYEASNGAGYSGKVTVVRLPDDEAAANQYSGTPVGTDDWARMDVTVYALGSCS